MSTHLILSALVFVLILNLFVGIVVTSRGEKNVAKMLSTQLLGTGTVATMLLMSLMDNLVLIDIALVFALLSGVTAVAFVQRVWRTEDSEH